MSVIHTPSGLPFVFPLFIVLISNFLFDLESFFYLGDSLPAKRTLHSDLHPLPQAVWMVHVTTGRLHEEFGPLKGLLEELVFAAVVTRVADRGVFVYFLEFNLRLWSPRASNHTCPIFDFPDDFIHTNDALDVFFLRTFRIVFGAAYLVEVVVSVWVQPPG